MWCLLECWSDSWHLPPPKRTNTPCCRKTRAMEGWPRNPFWERLRFSSIHMFKASPNRKDRPHASTRCSQCILCTVWILSGVSVMKDAKNICIYPGMHQYIKGIIPFNKNYTWKNKRSQAEKEHSGPHRLALLLPMWNGFQVTTVRDPLRFFSKSSRLSKDMIAPLPCRCNNPSSHWSYMRNNECRSSWVTWWPQKYSVVHLLEISISICGL